LAGRRLLWRLYPSYLIVTLVALVAVGVLASRSLRGLYRSQTASDLEVIARIARRELSRPITSGQQGRVESICSSLGPISNVRITVILPSGKVIGDSEEDPARMENHADRPEIIEALAGRTGSSTRYSPTLKIDMVYVAIPVRAGGRIAGVVRTSVHVRRLDAVLAAVRNRLVVGGLIVAVLAAAASFLISRRIARPLEEMRRGAERFAHGELEHRLSVPRTYELGALARAMNRMAAELDGRLRDITDQRNQHEAILASMVEAVIVVDMEERILDMNRAAGEVLDVEPDKVRGRTVEEAIRNTDLLRLVADALAGEGPVEGDVAVRAGAARSLQAHGTSLRGSDGERIGALVVLNDVTRLRRLEVVRRDFVANASHELRTPITAIKASAETLLEGAMAEPEDAGRFLGMILKQADRLNALVEDLLALSRIESEAETGPVSAARVAVGALLASAVGVCEPAADEKGITIDSRCDADLVAEIDPRLVEQAVVNLIDNAIKYSEPGSRIEVAADRDETGVVISVRDEGCGIAEEHITRIFERFYRVDEARSRALGGTGLGLAIVKHVALAHGGRVSVGSMPGKGSTFRIHLPARISTGPGADA
jgi:two-component system phosphate regulon sensor histidine kinase PhoR